MIIEFIDGKKVITHPSGQKDEYTKAQLEALKIQLEANITDFQNQINDLEGDISKC